MFKLIGILLITITSLYSYQTVSYGPDKLEEFDLFYKEQYSTILLTVHGGEWKSGTRKDINISIKGSFNQGVSIVNMDYKLSPEASIEDQIYNVAKVTAMIKKTFPKKELFLLGEGSGAHLVAMVSLNNKYLRKYKTTIKNSIKGSILINNPAFNFNYIYKKVDNKKKKLYSEILNNSLKKYSPIYNVSSRDIPKFLIFINSEDNLRIRDAKRFQKRLTKNATKSIIETIRIKKGSGESILFHNSNQKVMIIYKIFNFITKEDKLHNINDFQ